MPNGTGVTASLGAVVLCGGQSRRMGFDKWRLPIGEQTLLSHIIGQLAGRFRTIVVAGNDSLAQAEIDNKNWGDANVSFVADEAASSGPLEGMRRGIQYLSERCEFAYVTACDIPYFKWPVACRLLEEIKGHDAVIPVSDQRVYAMTAIYRTQIHEKIDSLIMSNRLRASELAQTLDSKLVPVKTLLPLDANLDCLKNINHPQDYFALLQSLGIECSAEIKKKLIP